MTSGEQAGNSSPQSHHHDPTFYRSPRDAAAGPPEKLAYVATFAPCRQARRTPKVR